MIAGAMGWSSVWGSGSALGDYLIPIPVAGGALHVPSFLVCSAILWNMPRVSALAAGHMRAFLLGVALAGVLLPLKVNAIWLAYNTQSSVPKGIWQNNPLSLTRTDPALLTGIDPLTLSMGISGCSGERVRRGQATCPQDKPVDSPSGAWLAHRSSKDAYGLTRLRLSSSH
jgi:hypothetical protein